LSNGESYLSTFQIKAVSVYKSSFEIKNSNFNQANQQFEMQVNVQPNFNIKKGNASKTAIVDLHLAINLKSNDISFVEVNLSINGVFSGESMNDQQFMEFVKFSGVSNLIQISRSYIFSMTSQLGIMPPILLPIINLEELYKNMVNAQNSSSM
jgi:preprotein translocase subunit SecB